MIRAFALTCALLATPAVAEGPAAAAQAAAERLVAATAGLEAAPGARDRVSALTEVVAAYEDGLAALRDGLRQAAIRERSLQADLDARADEVARLLGVLQTMDRVPAPLLMLHPSGPTGTARSGMILAEVTPALQVEVDTLRAQLEELQVLQAIQEGALQTLQDGLEGASRARAELSAAIADRTDLPRRFTEDPLQTSLIIASTETLDAFASGLAEIQQTHDDVPSPDATGLKGGLALPVQGAVLRRFDQTDAAGIARPGILVGTRPRALLTAPVAVTVRYNGPLLDYGTVLILEPAPDVLWVLSGLAEAFGEAGQVLPRGAALGLMGGETPAAQDILSESTGLHRGSLTETLYLEVREGQTPVNPAEWFALD
ncbi:MAG: Membrane-bound metallopeptidase [Rhodobacteraceae bacterium HLUCCA08]|nr:MAG: Membrane-bound metallopeptidase [Rhodobacteraceae bacterium HLUCCA08]